MTHTNICHDSLRYVARFRDRKNVTQNELVAVTLNKRFTYVMTGYEGYANDFTVLKDVLSLPPPHGLRVYEGGLTLNNNLFG